MDRNLERRLEALERQFPHTPAPPNFEERIRHTTEIIEAIENGEDLSRFDPTEVEEVRATLEDIRPILRKIADRL